MDINPTREFLSFVIVDPLESGAKKVLAKDVLFGNMDQDVNIRFALENAILKANSEFLERELDR